MTKFEIRDDIFFEVIDKHAELEVIADGFGFTEGPIWHPDEHWLMFSDIIGSRQYRWSEENGLCDFRQPSNQTNGNCFDREGRVVSCEHASSTLTRHDHDGKLIRVLASHFEGKELNSPNDVVVDSKGRIFFTDPLFGRTRKELGILRDPELDFCGVFRFDPDGTLECLVRDFKAPNGLCLSLDETRLYVNDSADPCIRVFDIGSDGSLSQDTVWARVEGDVVDLATGAKWVPDGMKLSTDGTLFCNGPGGVHVFDSNAKCLGVILVPEKSANFCFGGPARDMLFITASTRVYRIPTKVSGPVMIPGR